MQSRHSRLISALFLILLSSLVAALPAVGTDFSGDFWTGSAETTVERLIQSMTPEEIVSQLFLVSWPGTEPSRKLLDWVRNRGIGGVKIFGWNASNLQVMASTIGRMQQAALRSRHGIPLFTATDQEGGWVRHVKGQTSVTPGNMAIGASGLPYDAYRSAKIIGNELRALGINMNFAPTVDVYVNPKAQVIGPRSFSDDPVQVGQLGAAYFEGLEEARVIATAKHFPGHGNAAGDSHGTLPEMTGTMEELWNRDLLPYRFMIPEGLPAVMTGHLAFPTITDQSVPASVSPFFGKKVLRDRLEFDGLVITDDLYMGGATQYGRREGLSFAELCLQALKSGNDMIMLSQTPVFDGPIWQTVFREYKRNEAFRRNVRESVRRILRTKVEYLRPEDRVPLFPNPTALPESLADSESRQFFLEQAARSVTVIRNEDLPFTPSAETEILLASQDSLFLKQGQERYPNADTFLFRNRSFYSSSATDRRRFRERAEDYDVIIYNLADPNSLEVLQAAGALDARVIVFSTLTPVYLRELQDVETAIAVYGWGKESYRAGFSVLRGDFEAEGTLPFSLSKDE